MPKRSIIPSVYSFEFGSIRESLEDILKSKEVDKVHFDGLSDLSAFKDLMWKYMAIADIHLLSNTPLEELNLLIKMNLPFPIRVSMHVESTEDIKMFSKIAKDNKMSPGIAIKLKTPVPADINFYDGFDYVHLICNDNVSGLKSFQDDIFKKIEVLYKLLGDKCSITLDSGVKEEHIKPALEKGVSNLVMGSEIFKSENPFETVAKFSKLANSIK